MYLENILTYKVIKSITDLADLLAYGIHFSIPFGSLEFEVLVGATESRMYTFHRILLFLNFLIFYYTMNNEYLLLLRFPWACKSAFFVMYLLYINLADTMKYIVRVNGGKSAETGNWKKRKCIREKNKVKKTLRLCKKYQYL